MIISKQKWICVFVSVFSLSSSAFADSITVQAPKKAEIHLDQSAALKSVMQVPAGFSGDIGLSVDTSELPQGSTETTLTVTPEVLHVTKPHSLVTELPFQINIHSQPGSHSFKDLPVQVIAKAGAVSSSQSMSVTVDAIYEIDLYGGNIPEGWNSPMTLAMPKHDGGVTIRFVNMDTVSTHTIHGEDAIPHQETDPLAVATAGHPGGVYEIHVPSGDPVSGEYRCHDHETEDMLRTISFNN
jgi:hypothetical protein